jgi:hypothetical protein
MPDRSLGLLYEAQLSAILNSDHELKYELASKKECGVNGT